MSPKGFDGFLFRRTRCSAKDSAEAIRRLVYLSPNEQHVNLPCDLASAVFAVCRTEGCVRGRSERRLVEELSDDMIDVRRKLYWLCFA